ncbi:MAG: hypothetical protein KDC45_08145 [Bacteroidetes bacterium]|nr:hypothetical protein [Bacteroidota bacterium]
MNSFEKLLAQLVRNEVQYITVGGFACVFNGFVRPTEDVDILLLRAEKNLQQFLETMSRYGIGDVKVPYVDKKRLIEIKSRSNREIDRVDVVQLRKIPD